MYVYCSKWLNWSEKWVFVYLEKERENFSAEGKWGGEKWGFIGRVEVENLEGKRRKRRRTVITEMPREECQMGRNREKNEFRTVIRETAIGMMSITSLLIWRTDYFFFSLLPLLLHRFLLLCEGYNGHFDVASHACYQPPNISFSSFLFIYLF